MSGYGEQLLSKIVDTNDPGAFLRFGIEESHFSTEVERNAYRFIKEYAEQNRGTAPSYVTVVQEVDGFTYIPQVGDSYEYLTKKLKDNAGKRQFYDLLMSSQVGEKFSELETETFANWLITEAERIKIGIRTNVPTGKTLDELKYEMYDEYQKRKQGKSFKLYKTPFESLNKQIGGLFTGDIYGFMAESGRGKTYLIEKFIDCLLRQGANVLVKSYEVKSFIWLSRLISIITAEEGQITDEQMQHVGLPNKGILSAQLEGELEDYFFSMLDKINTYYPGKLFLQAKGDSSLTRTLDDLERELKSNSEIDVVVLDPFYGLSDVYGKNANKTTGGAAEQAASRFEQIVGDNDVIGMYSVQATVEKKSKDSDADRELKPPTRDQVKTSKRLLDIATNLFAFDSVDGNAQLTIEKGRNGGEDFSLDLIAILDLGVIRELPTGSAAEHFF